MGMELKTLPAPHVKRCNQMKTRLPIAEFTPRNKHPMNKTINTLNALLAQEKLENAQLRVKIDKMQVQQRQDTKELTRLDRLIDELMGMGDIMEKHLEPRLVSYSSGARAAVEGWHHTKRKTLKK